MKWHDSIKIKLILFFIAVSLFFLLFTMASFSLWKAQILEKSAVEKARLSTLELVDRMDRSKMKMEEDVLILASVTSRKYRDATVSATLMSALMNAMGGDEIQSGGVWFEPRKHTQSKTENVLFFNRNKKGKLTLIPHYGQSVPQNYREMEFYVLGKQLQEGETFWTKVYTDPVTHIRMITVVAPIYHHHTLIGVASLDTPIGQHMKHLTTLENSYSMLLDRRGTFIAKSAETETKIPADNIYETEAAHFPVVEMLRKNIRERREKAAKTYRKKARALAKQSEEISMEDAEMILSIRHEQRKSMETKTYFFHHDTLLGSDSVVILFYAPDTGMSLVVGMSEETVLASVNRNYRMILLIILFSTLVAMILGYFLLKKYFVSPLENVNRQLEHSMLEDGHYRFLECSDKGEIGQLVYNLNFRTLALEDAQRREKEEIQKRLTNEKLLIQQSKMAAMGEMMDAVAHQWKQPLNALSMYSEIIQNDFKEGSVDQRYIDTFKKNIQIQIDHMVDTLDEFRSFFRPNRAEELFTVSDILNSVLFLTKDEFMKHRISVNIEKEREITLHGSKNEFKHLILNLLNNAKDAFTDNDIQEKRIITIRLFKDNTGKKITIEDNAGGIPEAIIPDIFKAHVTTKEEGKGTGIGLYMSMQIAEKYGAELKVKNLNRGASFTILFKS